MKIAPSLIVAALTIASSSSLAAPTPITPPEHESTPAITEEFDDGGENKDSDKIEAIEKHPCKKDHVPMIASKEPKIARASASDHIRRSIPLVASGTNLYEKRDNLSKRGSIVDGLGLDGALAGLGLGGLVGTVEQTIGGLPLVGGPVGGLVKTVDDTVGVTDLLNPKSSKRQLDGLTGTVGNVAGGVPVVGGTASTVVGTLGGLTTSLPLGTVGNTAGGMLPGVVSQLGGYLPSTFGSSSGATSAIGGLFGQIQSAAGSIPLGSLSSVLGSLPSSTGNPLSSLSIAQAEAYGLLPTGFVHNLAVNLVQQEASATPSTANQVTGQVAGKFMVNDFHKHNETANSTETTWSSSTAPSSTKTPLPLVTPALQVTIPSPPVAPPASAPIAAPQPTPIDVAPTSVAKAAASTAAEHTPSAPAPIPTGHVQMTGNKLSASPPPPPSPAADSGSEYSDEDDDESVYSDEEDEEITPVYLQPTAAAAASSSTHPPTYTVTSSSTMAASPSQADATAEAMVMTASEAGNTAVPTTTGAEKRWARHLD
ncbi:hypothetical protein MNV49_005201 [Pseudohyphozyma bogoriensis]|nr:hypothetical protein MNV49_005201 [Pseudohyphozyma bogoriensis]